MTMNIFEVLESTYQEKEGSIKAPYHKKNTHIYFEARKKYLQGQSLNQIQRELRVAKSNLARWRDESNWEYEREQIRSKIEQKQRKFAEKDLERQLKVIRAFQATVIKTIKDGKIKPTIAEGIKALEYERELLGGHLQKEEENCWNSLELSHELAIMAQESQREQEERKEYLKKMQEKHSQAYAEIFEKVKTLPKDIQNEVIKALLG